MGVDDEVPIVVRHLVNQVVAEDAGAGDEDVEASVLLHGAVNQGFHRNPIRYVAGDRQRPLALTADLRGDRFCGVVIEVGDYDLRVLGGEAHRRGCADPSSAAGDQCGAPFESSAHAISTSASPTVTRTAR